MQLLTAFVSTTALVLVTTSGAFAQARPDFSGTWTFDPASLPAAPAGGGVGPPGELTLRQDAGTLTIEYGPTPAVRYNLDGSESRNWDGTSKAMWQDNRLVIVTPLNAGGREIELRRVLSMDGADLVMEMTLPSLQGGDPTVRRFVYKKRLLP